MIDFPTLQPDSADFMEEVAYEVKAKHNDGKLIITHSLTGESFIKQLIDEGKARFSVALFYKDSAQRRHNVFGNNPRRDKNGIIAKQEIANGFSYGPEIKANIITIEDVKIPVDEQSGLGPFWQAGSNIHIPSHARIASYPDLTFYDGSISSIISIKYDDNLTEGTLKVKVDKIAGVTEHPIKVLCAKDVFDQLRKIKGVETLEHPKDEKDAIRLAIVTQILCAAYAEIIKNREEEITNESLIEHLKNLEEKTGENCEDDDFNPSLAATKMLPYCFSY